MCWCPADIGASSEQITFLGRLVNAVGHEVSRIVARVSQLEKTLPGKIRPAGENHITALRIASDEDFLSLETEFRGYADCLAPAISEQLCSAWHSVSPWYRSTYITACGIAFHVIDQPRDAH